jgi:hypothetical protein
VLCDAHIEHSKFGLFLPQVNAFQFKIYKFYFFQTHYYYITHDSSSSAVEEWGCVGLHMNPAEVYVRWTLSPSFPVYVGYVAPYQEPRSFRSPYLLLLLTIAD